MNCSASTTRNNDDNGRLAECGVLLVDKPRGITSHDVVARVRRHTGVRKTGHAGTLDPFATGLLLVMIGRATRLFDFFLPLAKEYHAIVQFGSRSSTGDSEGEIVAAGGVVTGEELSAVLPDFTGTIRQRVPAYSAVKVEGEPLYRKARRGERVAPPERDVEVHAIELKGFDAEAQRGELRIRCSSGTYIRSLCEDIAERAGSAAYTAELRRTAVGDFSAAAAMGIERVEAMPPQRLLSPESNPSFNSCFSALYFLPVRQISDNETRAVRNGRPLEGEAEGPVRVASGGELLAVYGPGRESRLMHPMVVFS